MAIIVAASDPIKLAGAIKTAMQARQLDPWEVNDDGEIRHSSPQWKNRACFRSTKTPTTLEFGIVGNKDAKFDHLVYAALHSEFIEMLLTHFDKLFTDANITAKMTPPDVD